MTSVPGTDTLAWSDEQPRFYLQLRLEEKLKENVRKQIVNDTDRQPIIDKFYEAYGERHPWKKFGIKHTTCKKQYDNFKRLIHKRTGRGYDSSGFIDMSDDWWNELCKEWPAARKLKDKPVPNIDLMEKVFGTIHITGGEGWTAQQGEDHLDQQGGDHLGEDHDDDDAGDTETIDRQIPPTQETNAPAESRTVGSSSSSRPRANRKRSRAAQVGQAVADAISDNNRMLGCYPEFSCNQHRAMEALHSLSAIRHWSPLYNAAINHLKEYPTNRQTCLFFNNDENKVMYLEFATGKVKMLEDYHTWSLQSHYVM